MKNNMIAKRVYVGKYAGSCSVGRPRKKWIYTAKECLKKRDIDVRQAMRMVHDRSLWRGFMWGNALAVDRGMNPDFDEIPQL